MFVRRWRDDLPEVVDVEPGFRVVHVEAGPHDLAKEKLPEVVDEFTDGVRQPPGAAPTTWTPSTPTTGSRAWPATGSSTSSSLPLVSTFHTLARVKAETGDAEPARRVQAETEVIGCSDAILASCRAEAAQLVELYGAAPERIEIVAPGVDHAFFSPGDQGGARRALRLGDHPVLLFVGRIQPLKGADVAVRALADLRRRHPDALLVIVGGASGARRPRRAAPPAPTGRRAGSGRARCASWPPQPHHLLSTYYRAADLCIVPSRSESFGLVALEAAACGTPVVAAEVGGLATLVDHGRTGYLVEGRRSRATTPGSPRSCSTTPGPPEPWPRPRWPAAARLPLVDGRGPAAPASTPTSPPGPWSSAGEATGGAGRSETLGPITTSRPAPTSSTGSRPGSTPGWPSSWPRTRR